MKHLSKNNFSWELIVSLILILENLECFKLNTSGGNGENPTNKTFCKSQTTMNTGLTF